MDVKSRTITAIALVRSWDDTGTARASAEDDREWTSLAITENRGEVGQRIAAPLVARGYDLRDPGLIGRLDDEDDSLRRRLLVEWQQQTHRIRAFRANSNSRVPSS